MTSFLTTQDVQNLLHVDRSTVYRMAEDGRLPGVKVGRQWRFPADRIADQLGLESAPGTLGTVVALAGPTDAPAPRLELVMRDAARSVAELLADLYEVMAVVTDMEGNPLTRVVNPCGFYSAIADQPGAAEMCVTEWRAFAQRTQITPRFTASHLGFRCARTFAWVDRQPVGMLLIGGVTPPDWPPGEEWTAQIAHAVGLDPAAIDSVVDETYDVPLGRQRWMLQTLPHVGDLVSQLLTAQSRLASKLGAIADIARPSENRTGS